MTRRVSVLLRSERFPILTVPAAQPLALVMLLAGACTSGHDVAMEGRRAVVGMNADAFQACAGIPNRTKRLDPRTEIFSYELKNENVGGMEFSVPLVGGGFKVAGSGSYCHTIVRVVDGKVAEVNYTGDNDDFVGKDGVCAPIVRGCLRAHGNHAETSSR
jgi:hypothetical protein